MSNTKYGLGNPWAVSAPDGKVTLLVMNQGDPLPAVFALIGTTVKRRVCLRLTGGCSGMSAEDKAAMLDYFDKAFRGFEGLFFSGATRSEKDGEVDPMITDIPVFLVPHNPGAKVLGTVPRTELFTLQGEHSRLVLDSGGTGLNPGYSGILVVQKDPQEPLGWDGDLAKYFELMEQWHKHGGFEAVGVAAWNGGGVTAKEIEESARRGWPTILVKGSGRKADEYSAKLEAGDHEFLAKLPPDHRVVVVDRADPQTLRAALLRYGFIAEAGQ